MIKRSAPAEHLGRPFEKPGQAAAAAEVKSVSNQSSPWTNTMHRCVSKALALTALAVGANFSISLSAQAQTHRQFPPQTLRADLLVTQAPDINLNGQAARLSPGSRIRDANNLLLLSASLSGQTNTVHFTVDEAGLVRDVWLLNAAELSNKTWPRTRQEAVAWAFEPGNQTWTKR
jgi:hypothetical protein